MTVGAPDAPKNPPAGVDVLEMRGTHDLVPAPVIYGFQARHAGFFGGGPSATSLYANERV